LPINKTLSGGEFFSCLISGVICPANKAALEKQMVIDTRMIRKIRIIFFESKILVSQNTYQRDHNYKAFLLLNLEDFMNLEVVSFYYLIVEYIFHYI